MRIRFQIQGFDDQKLGKNLHEKNIYSFDQQFQFPYSYAFIKGRPSFRRSLQPSEEIFSTSKHKFFHFFLFPIRIRMEPAKVNADPCGHFLNTACTKFCFRTMWVIWLAWVKPEPLRSSEMPS
jgi:hypothetical protein